MPGSNSLRQQRLASNRAVRCLPVPANPCSTPAVRSGTHLGLLSPPTLKSTLFLHSSGISTFHLHTLL
ncbi:hypothetical protein OPV22_032112 [Ensete ventricosum]|uniref:Uncharacterized protein n=1 Tax=Ensete ventricosum TaxID=4639 RepID=A0AAV8P1W3_ENSVE|nr:hypothetical protein OPV22_032112 [Ensete ventricosum]